MIKFYICRTCGNLIEMIDDSGNTPKCCGEKMDELIPGTTDGAKETHIPVITKQTEFTCSEPALSCMKLVTIQIGERPHAMTREHHIAWVCVLTNEGVYRKKISSSDNPIISFCLKKDEQIKAIYSYCNLHELWSI